MAPNGSCRPCQSTTDGDDDLEGWRCKEDAVPPRGSIDRYAGSLWILEDVRIGTSTPLSRGRRRPAEIPASGLHTRTPEEDTAWRHSMRGCWPPLGPPFRPLQKHLQAARGLFNFLVVSISSFSSQVRSTARKEYGQRDAVQRSVMDAVAGPAAGCGLVLMRGATRTWRTLVLHEPHSTCSTGVFLLVGVFAVEATHRVFLWLLKHQVVQGRLKHQRTSARRPQFDSARAVGMLFITQPVAEKLLPSHPRVSGRTSWR
jgi:hypothetical protein